MADGQPRHREELRPYQRAGVRFIKEKKRCALFVDPGLGKTSITLTAVCDMIDELECGRVLVVAPPQVASKVWHRELAAWAHLKDKSYVVIKGSVAQRRKLLARPASFHIVSMESLPWLLQELGGTIPQKEIVDDFTGDVIQERTTKWRAPPDCPYNAIIVDESSKVKSQDTNRWRVLKQLALMPCVEYVVELTGTPSTESYENLWSQIYLLDGGQRLGGTLTAYRERWFERKYEGAKLTVKDYARKVIEDRIADIVFTLREEDYADLPPRMYADKRLTPDDALLKKYKKFEREYVLQLTEEKKMIARDGAAITMKLLQLASGVVYNEEGKNGESKRVEYDLHRLKLDALHDLADEYNGQPLLVVYEFKSDVRRILAEFKDARLFDGTEAMQDAWNRGEIGLMLVHRKSAAHGLNLQFGGNNVVWYTLCHSLEDYIQLNKRLHRSGQTKTVMIHHLIVEGTIDEDVLVALAGKNDMQEALLNALKKRIEEYVKQG